MRHYTRLYQSICLRWHDGYLRRFVLHTSTSAWHAHTNLLTTCDTVDTGASAQSCSQWPCLPNTIYKPAPAHGRPYYIGGYHVMYMPGSARGRPHTDLFVRCNVAQAHHRFTLTWWLYMMYLPAPVHSKPTNTWWLHLVLVAYIWSCTCQHHCMAGPHWLAQMVTSDATLSDEGGSRWWVERAEWCGQLRAKATGLSLIPSFLTRGSTWAVVTIADCAYSNTLLMKSRKRRAYCSGLTVEISAPAPCFTVLAACAVRFFIP